MKKFFIFIASNLLLACNTPLVYSNESDFNYFLKNSEAIRLINDGKISEGEKKCDEMIEMYPEGKLGYLCKGSSLLFSGLNNRKEEALKNFTKAIEIDPHNPYLFFWRGFAFEVMQEYQQAIKDLSISLKLDPEFSLARSLLDHIENK